MAKKKTYRIGDACSQVDIQPYVLRYWETEFPPLSPDKSQSGQRLYTESDLLVIRRIKELLYDEGYTIAGAKKKLEGELESGGPQLARAGQSAEPSAEEAAEAKSSAATETAEEPAKEAVEKKASKKKTKTAARSRSKAKKASPKTEESAAKPPKDDDAARQLAALRKAVEKALTDARNLLEELSS